MAVDIKEIDQTGGPSGQARFKAPWIPLSACLTLLSLGGTVNTTSWHVCHLREPPATYGSRVFTAQTTQVRRMLHPASADTDAAPRGSQMLHGADARRLSQEAVIGPVMCACTWPSTWTVWECTVTASWVDEYGRTQYRDGQYVLTASLTLLRLR